MKMQLSPITTTTIANSRPSYSTPQQRQGTFVELPLRDLVKDAQNDAQNNAIPELATYLGLVLKKIRANRDGLIINVTSIDGEYFLQTLDRDGNTLGLCLLGNPLDANTLLDGLWSKLVFLKSPLLQVIRKLIKTPR